MKMQYRNIIVLIVLLGLLPISTLAQKRELLDGKTWKKQGLTTIIPAWIENGIDPADGQFYAFMDRQWKPYKDGTKYPGMLSRHLFSFSTAYMLSGEQQYLDRADQLFNYLVKHGWDQEYGGWHYAINTKGKAINSKKDLFMNIYAITGLSMYYMVTHNEEAMQYIQKSRSLLQQYAWDHSNGGYYKSLNRSWKVTDSTKVFTPQIAPVSGYLLYLYAATQEQEYLDETKKLMSLAENHLQDTETGWIREKFDAEWNSLAKTRSDERLDIGHNIEVSWMWLRLHAITGTSSYKQKAKKLYNQLHRHAFRSNGSWLRKMNMANPEIHPSTTSWWVQAYGNMLQLAMAGYGKEPQSLESYQKGATFWNKAFVDQKYGGTILSATLEGAVDRGHKAVRSKTSYHAMELSLLKYLYLNLLINKEPVSLYFNFDSDSDDKPLCPLPIYSSGATITGVTLNGKSVPVTNQAKPCISLPKTAGTNNPIKIRIE